ncbi:hypothetical protein [Peribacillus alkalitolerans]|uniref:hypothetical protein n=1 Tax=Peribacillus alkalitolerans TaxID=1550385 RepID=UPI0013D7925E|nr:hypothetical protein [Peribacillus alkalitolerans]
MAEKKKVKRKGQVFFSITLSLFLIITYFFIKSGFEDSYEMPILMSIVLIFTSIINIIQNIKNRQPYYVAGSLLAIVMILVFFLIPKIINWIL